MGSKVASTSPSPGGATDHGSSLWVHETRRQASCAWQTGYGAFSVSQSNVPSVVRYIRSQDQHHRKASFQEEFIAFLKRHGIAYDERYIWE